jgi:hypothetical protein
MRPLVLRLISAACLSTALTACVHDSNADRLEGDQGIDPRELAAMLKLDCSQRREEVQLARDEGQSDFDRVANYRLALKAFNGAAERIEAAFTKNSDLLYLAESDALRLRLQRCQAQAVTFTDELRKFELTVQFKPKSEAEPKREVATVAPAPQPEPVKKVKELRSSKKSKKKTALAKAKRKKAGRAHAVLADASH